MIDDTASAVTRPRHGIMIDVDTRRVCVPGPSRTRYFAVRCCPPAHVLLVQPRVHLLSVLEDMAEAVLESIVTTIPDDHREQLLHQMMSL